MNLNFNGKLFPQIISVCDISPDAIIGQDFLLHYVNKIDYQRMVVQTSLTDIQCWVAGETQMVCRVEVKEEITIPANSRMFIPVDIPFCEKLSESCMIEPSVRLFDEKNIAILPAILQTSTENKVLGDCESYYEKNSIAVCCTEVSLDENPEESNLPEYLKELWERSCIHLNENESIDFANLLKRYNNVFSKSSDDIGRTSLIQHEINTENAVPIRQPPRRLHFGKRQIEKDEIQRMLKLGVIEPSTSSWSSPVVLIAKKGGQGRTRFCVDFRGVNGLMTEKIAYPIPRIDDCLDALSTASFYGYKCEEAFTRLKEVLTSPPILGYPIIGSKFILDTDASDKALGAVLSQEQDGQERVIAYMSKAMTKPEQSYCVTRKELLAVCALRHFHSYLYGQPILIRTDYSAVSWMRNLKAPTGQVARWLQELGTYDLTVVHRPGLKHRNADAISRNPCASCSRQESVNNVHDITVTRSKADTSPTRNQFVLLGWDVNTLRQQQLQDKIIGQLFIKFEDKETKREWNSLSEESTDLKTLWNMWEVTLPLQAVIPSRLQTVHELASKNLEKKVQYQKKYYDVKSKKRMFTAGQRVWLNDPTRKIGVCSVGDDGWKEGTKFDGPPGEELFQPVYSGDETRAASSSSMDMDITKPEAWRITYVALVPQSIMAEAVFGRETYRFAIADTLLTDVKYVSALTRRMLAIPQGELFAPPTKNPVILKKKSSLKPTISAKKSSKISSTVANKPEKPSINSSSSNTPTTAPVTVVPSSPKTSSPKPSTPPTTPAVTSSPLALSPISTGSFSPTMPPVSPPAKKPKISTKTIPYTPEKPTQPGPTYIPTPKQLLATITTEDIPSVELRTPSERATSLLRIGGMPLFPPARRDWTGEVQVKLPGDVLTTDWPPQDWKDITPDTRKNPVSCTPPEFGKGDDQNDHDDHEYEEERRYSRDFGYGDASGRPKGNNRSFYIKPDSYSGSSDWDEYYSRFEDCVELGGLSDKEKCLTLTASLRGPARTFYISLTIAERRNYDILVSKLQQRFGCTRQQSRWLSRFESRKRLPCESIAMLGDELRQLSQKAYTILDSRAQEALALNQLYKSVSLEMKCRCIDKECATISDAVQVIERYEAILGEPPVTEKKKTAVRQISTDDDQDYSFDQLNARVAKLEQTSYNTPTTTPQTMYKANVPSQGKFERKCFMCESPRHIIKHCPMLKKVMSYATNQSRPYYGSNNTGKQQEHYKPSM
ncbi:unnamed protein product [Mytilus coruscus]|uniref:Reverse transcriptase RNase H-like domain-containing protein n=1 Tax=Mytilus coruscus TaxID=42192 RepID=A0A6J8ATY0_MYTCO|nr:unnamed protein product [Mytilus coruscus]